VEFRHESKTEVRMTYSPGADLAVANRISKIIIDNNLVDVARVRTAVGNFDELANSLSKYTAGYTESVTGLDDGTLTRAAESFAKKSDRFLLIGNDILDTGQGEAVLNAILNLCLLAHHGGEGSVNVYSPREHCNSQGANDMGLSPDFLPGYRSPSNTEHVNALAQAWGLKELKLDQEKLVSNLWDNCSKGWVKMLYIAGEDPCHSYYQGAAVKDALRTVPFLVVQDVYMTETARMADIILPTCTYAEKEGTFTNMTRHVQRVAPAVLPEGQSRSDFDVFMELAERCGKPFSNDSVSEVQREIEVAAPIYKGMFPGSQWKQWSPEQTGHQPGFAVAGDEVHGATKEGYPFTLITNNHMFHIGNYSHYAKALEDIGADCIAEINSKDARNLGVQSGDTIRVESGTHSVELPVEVNGRSTQGIVYIPKNWVDIPVNMLRNGEGGLVSVKVTKAG
jgi:predicted molibdopterin-dependent oxidoreductase YjgC